jgi:asparagine synthase (glutamine-hydrolysing)
MCGIFSSFSHRLDLSLGHWQTFGVESLKHRGPDCLDFYSSEDSKVFLGHALLSISSRSQEDGQQPMKTDSSVIVFNGEIYNHKALREQLISEGSQFNGHSDTEVLLRGIETHGWAFLDTVEGCWAFVMYELSTGKLYFSRDPLGEKQLVYKLDHDGLVIASEAKSILAVQDSTRLDSSRILSDLIFDFFSNRELTYFHNLKNCRPGSVYSYDMKGCLQQIYTCDFVTQQPHLPLRSKLCHAVSSMVPEHHDCAVVLSGGLDSSIIASLLKTEVRNMHFTAITAAYEGGSNEDLAYARELVAHLGGINHLELKVNAGDVTRNFLAVQTALEEPLHDQVYITQYLIYKRLSSLGFRVALNGQGADEFWGGYHYHYGLQDLYALNIDAAVEHFQKQANARGLHRLLTQEEILQLIEQNLFSRWAKATPLQNMLMEGHLQAMISHEDKLSMASGVEIRLPFLNQALVTHAMKLTTEDKVRFGVEKAPLRQAMSGILMERIRVRRKQAFPDMPANAYISLDFLADLTANNGLFSKEEIRKVSRHSPKLEWRMSAINAFVGTFSGMT